MQGKPRQQRILKCSAQGREFCIPPDRVQSVYPQAELVLSSSADHPALLGTISYQEQALPIYDLGRLLGLSDQPENLRAQILIIKDKRQPWGILVDTLSPATMASELLPIPALLNPPHLNLFQGLFSLTDNTTSPLLPLLNLDGLNPQNSSSEFPQSELPNAENEIRPQTITQSFPNKQGNQRKHQLVSCALEPANRFLAGLSITQLQEVLQPLPVYTLPGLPPAVLGYVIWRNLPVPLMDVGIACGISEETRMQRLLIARGPEAGDLVAIPISAAPRIHRIPFECEPCFVPMLTGHHMLSGTFISEAGIILLLDLPKILKGQISEVQVS